jgi:hypothetical protein
MIPNQQTSHDILAFRNAYEIDLAILSDLYKRNNVTNLALNVTPHFKTIHLTTISFPKH